MVRIWHKQHETIAFQQSRLVIVMYGVGDQHLNTTVYFSVVADHIQSFMTTVYPFYDDSFHQDNSACHKVKIKSPEYWKNVTLSHDKVS